MKKLLWFTLASVCAAAQPFTFGFKVGTPANDVLDTVQGSNFNFHTYTNRYLVGPTAELRLPFGLGVEFDALYRHYNFQTSGTLPPNGGIPPITTTVTGNASTGAWEFPLLAKYRFPFPIVRPFVDAGVAWDRLQGFTQTVSVLSSTPLTAPSGFNQPVRNTTTGFVIGGGLEIHVPFVRISPEIRYTRWGSQLFQPNAAFPGTAVVGGLSSNQNQLEAMVGITF